MMHYTETKQIKKLCLSTDVCVPGAILCFSALTQDDEPNKDSCLWFPAEELRKLQSSRFPSKSDPGRSQKKTAGDHITVSLWIHFKVTDTCLEKAPHFGCFYADYFLFLLHFAGFGLMFIWWWGGCRFMRFWVPVLKCSQHAELWEAEEAAADSQSFWEHLTYFFLLEFNGALRRRQAESRKVGSTSTVTHTHTHTELGSDPVSPNICLSDWWRRVRLAGILSTQYKKINTHKERDKEGEDRGKQWLL